MPELGTLGAALRYAVFAALAIAAPGIALQRLARVRIDPALVLPLGFSACAGLYWLGLRLGLPWAFPLLLLLLAAGAALVRGPWRLTSAPPSLRGALPPFLGVVLALALAEYPQNLRDAEGGLRVDAVLPDDTAFHVGLTYELAQGYPPQIPGLSGLPLGYHLGASLARAAALRYAGVHPLDALTRFDNTLYALALILALRSAARCVGGGPLGQALAGWSVLAADLSFLVAPGRGIEWWAGVFEGGTGLLSLFHANSLILALALALAALVALQRHLVWEGAGYLAMAALLGAACPFFKVFVGAQLLGGLAAALLLSVERPGTAVVAGATAIGTAALVLGGGGETMQVVLEPLRVTQDARADLGLEPAAGAGLALWAGVWLLSCLGVRAIGLPAARRALLSRRAVRAALATMAIAGYLLGLLLRISPVEAGSRERPFNEALYFFELSGFLLGVFAANTLGRLAKREKRPWLVVAAAALLALPSSLQFVLRKSASPPRRLPPAILRATDALVRASRPGDVVLVRPDLQRFPPPPLLVGRRVPYTRFIPFFTQFLPRGARLGRYQQAAAFFQTRDPEQARRIARALGAGYVCVYGAEGLGFPTEGVLETLFEEPGARLYRVR